MSESFGDDQQAELRLAADLYRPLAKAAKRAHSNGMGMAVIGGSSLAITAMLADPIGIVLSAVAATAGVIEVRQGRRLAAAEPDAPTWLCRNELVLGAALALYFILKLTIWKGETSAELERQLGAGQAGGIGALADSLEVMFYAICLAATFLYQGGMARYFLKQRGPLERYRNEVAEWARDVVQSVKG